MWDVVEEIGRNKNVIITPLTPGQKGKSPGKELSALGNAHLTNIIKKI